MLWPASSVTCCPKSPPPPPKTPPTPSTPRHPPHPYDYHIPFPSACGLSLRWSQWAQTELQLAVARLRSELAQLARSFRGRSFASHTPSIVTYWLRNRVSLLAPRNETMQTHVFLGIFSGINLPEIVRWCRISSIHSMCPLN